MCDLDISKIAEEPWPTIPTLVEVRVARNVLSKDGDRAEAWKLRFERELERSSSRSTGEDSESVTAMTDFLKWLNSGEEYAGQCQSRLLHHGGNS